MINYAIDIETKINSGNVWPKKPFSIRRRFHMSSCLLTIIYIHYSLPFNLINVLVLRPARTTQPPSLTPFLSMSFWCLFSPTLHSFVSFGFCWWEKHHVLACFGLCSFVMLVLPEIFSRTRTQCSSRQHNNNIKWTRYWELVQWLYDNLMFKWWSIVKTKCHKSHES